MSSTMRIVSWNVRGIRGISEARRERIVEALERHAPDALILQEVGWKDGLHDDLARRLRATSWTHIGYGGVLGSKTKRYGNLVASRTPLELQGAHWAGGTPWAQSFVRATVRSEINSFDLVGVHIPNGSGNGWKKIETFEALARGLETIDPATPFVLAGDFNEPRAVQEDGTVIPFGTRQLRDGTWSSSGMKTGKCGGRHPKRRWVDGVKSILGENPLVPLRHVCREVGGRTAWHTTHIVRGTKRFFDHILVSPHWKVHSASFDHSVREDGTSDHSLAWAELSLAN